MLLEGQSFERHSHSGKSFICRKLAGRKMGAGGGTHVLRATFLPKWSQQGISVEKEQGERVGCRAVGENNGFLLD